ncbi:trypsin CFT-1-like [Maniola hyperantus]|uniref:trypsin CFT-1-like n=1 Tax=Aphantopus hyperantus TaxID=2795564 RepID=UPI001568390F|nr:trypsin CFT-1-like [Maniola hyperantus]
MKTIIILVAICLATVASLPRQQERIIGGSLASINSYPFATGLQITSNGVRFQHACGGTILNNRSILSAAHCWFRNPTANRYRVRVGSANSSSGGWLHNVARLIGHPQHNMRTHDNDIGIIRVSTAIQLGSASVRAGSIAQANINIPDNSDVIAIGWGVTSQHAQVSSEQLRHVGLRTTNQARCQSAFGGFPITANMLCANWEAGGRAACFGDSGTGLVFRGVVVGVCSFSGTECANGRWPNVFARVSRYTAWIRNNS